MRFASLLFILTGLFGAGPAWAGMSSQTTVKTEAEKKEQRNWNGSLSFASGTDLNKEEFRRTYRHNLSTSFSYVLTKSVSMSSGTGLSWFSEGQNIRKEQDNPAWDDLFVGIGWGTKLLDDSHVSLSMDEALPTGNESRQEGTRSVLSTGAGFSTSFLGKRISLGTNLGVTRLFQTYDTSITTGESNPEWVSTGTLSLGFAILKRLRLGFSGSTASVHFINGENALRSSAGSSLSYAFKGWSISLSYSIGSYEKNDGYRMLYFDETRSNVRLGVSIEI